MNASSGALRPLAAMILAAGRGERMRPLTDTTPKPLLRVRGETLIERQVRACARAQIRRIVVNLWWLGAQIREHLGDGSRYGVTIVYSEEQPQALETAGGIIRALPHLLPGPFAVVNGDVYSDYPLDTLRLPANCDANLVLVPNPAQHPRGDFGFAAGRALAEAAQRWTFAGIAIYRSSFFAGYADGPQALKPLMVRSMNAGRCASEIFTGVWEDVGTPERLRALNAGLDGPLG